MIGEYLSKFYSLFMKVVILIFPLQCISQIGIYREIHIFYICKLLNCVGIAFLGI